MRFIFFIMLFIALSFSCRFIILFNIENQTFELNTFKQLFYSSPDSFYNREWDGWSIAFYKQQVSIPVIIRSPLSPRSDKIYIPSILKILDSNPHLILLHFRKATSGIKPITGNPHNFVFRDKNQTWVFGHNGNIDKKLLLKFLGTQWFSNHSLVYGSLNNFSSTIDSELFFNLLLKQIYFYNNIEKGANVTIDLLINADKKYSNANLNFYITNGKKLCVYSSANSGYYSLYKANNIISSEPINLNLNWTNLGKGLFCFDVSQSKFFYLNKEMLFNLFFVKLLGAYLSV